MIGGNVLLFVILALLCWQSHAYVQTCFGFPHAYLRLEEPTVPSWPVGSYKLDDLPGLTDKPIQNPDFNSWGTSKGVSVGSNYDFAELYGKNDCIKGFGFPIHQQCVEQVLTHLAPAYDFRAYSKEACAYDVGRLFKRDPQRSTCYYHSTDAREVHAKLVPDMSDPACCWHFVEDASRLFCWALDLFPGCRQDLSSDYISESRSSYWLTAAAQQKNETWCSGSCGEDDAAEAASINLYNALATIKSQGPADYTRGTFEISLRTERCMRTAIGWSRLHRYADFARGELLHALKIKTIVHTVNKLYTIGTYAQKGQVWDAAAHSLDLALKISVDALHGTTVRFILRLSKKIHKLFKMIKTFGLDLSSMDSVFALANLDNTDVCTACYLANDKLIPFDRNLHKGRASTLCGFQVEVSDTSTQSIQAILAAKYLESSEEQNDINNAVNNMEKLFGLQIFSTALEGYRNLTEKQRATISDNAAKANQELQAAVQEFKDARRDEESLVTKCRQGRCDGDEAQEVIKKAQARLKLLHEGAVTDADRAKNGHWSSLKVNIAEKMFGWTGDDAKSVSRNFVSKTKGAVQYVGQLSRSSAVASSQTAQALSQQSTMWLQASSHRISHVSKLDDDDDDVKAQETFIESGSDSKPILRDMHFIETSSQKCLDYDSNSNIFTLTKCKQDSANQIFNVWNLEGVFSGALGVGNKAFAFREEDSTVHLTSTADITPKNSVGLHSTSGCIKVHSKKAPSGILILDFDEESGSTFVDSAEDEVLPLFMPWAFEGSDSIPV